MRDQKPGIIVFNPFKRNIRIVYLMALQILMLKINCPSAVKVYRVVNGSQFTAIRACMKTLTPLCYRYARQKERDNVRLLSRTVRGHYVHHKNQTKDAILFLQPDCAMRAHLVDGSPWLYAAS